MRDNTKLKVLIVLALLLIVLICVAVGLSLNRNAQMLETVPTETNVPETSEPAETETFPATEVPTEEVAETTEPVQETEAPTETPTEAPQATQGQTNTNQGGNNNSKPSSPGAQQGSSGTQTQQPATEPPVVTLSFPYTIPGTSLVIQKIDSYSGIFLENGTDETVDEISAMVLVNNGSVGVEYADITLTQGSRQLQFKATAIPAGATVVVQEANAAAYSSASYSACTADVAELEVFEMSASMLKVEENEDVSLQVTNLTNQTIPCVRIFYKFILEAGEIYVGGITYNAKLVDLQPGATMTVSPSHYAAGASEIIMVRTYDTAE